MLIILADCVVTGVLDSSDIDFLSLTASHSLLPVNDIVVLYKMMARVRTVM